MNYLTSNLWRKLSSPDETIRQQANSQWDEAWQQYHDYMEEKVHKNISKKHWCTIIRCHDHHDSIINQIRIDNCFYKKKPSLRVNIILDNKIQLQLINVTHCLFDIQNQSSLPCGSFSWGYCEFELIDKKMKLSILCDISNQFDFEFDNIAIHKLTTITSNHVC